MPSKVAEKVTRSEDKPSAPAAKQERKAIEDAVRSRFPQKRGDISCRFVYPIGDASVYRVNWYTEKNIDSVMVLVRSTPDGLVVEDRTNVRPINKA